MKIDNPHEFMCIDELPDLFEYLLNNDYEIDYKITKLLKDPNLKSAKSSIICSLNYN